MSTWTHINGSIRIDALQEFEPIEEIEKCFGKILRFEDMRNKNSGTTLPCGSEGSLEYKILVNPKKNDMAAYVVVIWGDLRDYDNAEEVKVWFKNIIYNSGFLIRQAVLQVEVESEKSEVIVFDIDEVEPKIIKKNERKD
jgi:hypothetical protein